MSDAKAIAEAYAHRVWDNKDLTTLDDLLHDNVVIHSLLGDFQGADAMRKVVMAYLTGFPDLKVTNGHVISEGELVAIQWKAEGTHLGEFKGKAATRKRVSYTGVTLYRVKQGRIIEYWAYLDMLHLLDQIS